MYNPYTIIVNTVLNIYFIFYKKIVKIKVKRHNLTLFNVI
jgi:hypothetical protein